jgi:energy-coupling factor transport system substrate-specific component
MSTTQSGVPTGTPTTSTTRTGWRVVDMVVAAVLGVAGGFFLWAVAVLWAPMTTPLAVWPPLSAILVGLFLVPGVLGGLVVRKPGAAVFTELVAAALEALLGNSWGFSTVYYGLLEGLGAEIVFLLFVYRKWTAVVAVLAGAGAGLACGVLDTTLYYPDFPLAQKSAYISMAIVSGAVIAGLGSHLLTRALAATGALSAMASGRRRELV